MASLVLKKADTKKCTTILISESVLSSDVSEENLTNDDCRVDSPSLLPKNKMPKYEMAETVDGMWGASENFHCWA